MGKGRTIAGIIYENYLNGRKKALWISVSNDLKYDAERDLKDIGASKIEVHRLNKVFFEIIPLEHLFLNSFNLRLFFFFFFSSNMPKYHHQLITM